MLGGPSGPNGVARALESIRKPRRAWELGSVAISAESQNLGDRSSAASSRDPLAGTTTGSDVLGPSLGGTSGYASSSHGHTPALPRDGFLQIVWRQRFVVVACVALGVVLAGLYLLVATPVYKSEASVLVQSASGTTTLIKDDNSNHASQPGTINLFREADLIRSTPILAHTLADPSIQELKTFDDVDNRFEYLKGHLDVDVGSKNELITVSFLSPVKEDAAKIVEGVVQSYKDFQTKKSQTATDHLLEVLAKERKSLEEALAAKSTEMVKFKRDHGVLFNEKDRGDINVERFKSLSTALMDAQMETLKAKSAYTEAVRSLGNDPAKLKQVQELQAFRGFTPVSAAEEATLRSELFQWQTRLGDMQQQYLPNHPTVRNLQKRVDQLSVAYVAAMERRYRGAQEREAELQQRYDEQRDSAITRSADADTYARLDQDVKTKELQLQTVDKQIRDLNLLEAASAAVDVQVVEPARVPDRVALPNRKKSLAIGLVLGLVAGLGLACVRDWLDPRLRTVEEIKAVLGMPILGMVPKMPDNLAPAVRGQKLLLDPGSEAAEAYRALRTAIKFGVPEGRAKTILVASPTSGDGKTTVASNLAIGLAQVGKRVLLLDCDLRHPRQHETFGIENHAGLADVLAHDMTAAEVSHKTVVPNLEIIPAGPTPENPADLLNSQRFIEVVEELMDRYDHVIIDSPPVMAVTDARIIAASCDVTILVLRADRTDRKMCEMSRDGLASVGANLVGLVMNYVPPGTGIYSGDAAYYGVVTSGINGNGTNGGSRGSSRVDEDEEENVRDGEHAGTPLVAIDAMKTLNKRPNQIRS
jgi:capsular exopolysaccharide synthesis family protein